MAANPAIEAVLWDFGGVLTTSPFDAFNRYEAEHSLPRDFIRSVNATNPHSNAWARFESASISAAEFDQMFLAETEALGHPVPGRAVIALLSGDLRPRMVAALDAVGRCFKTACITNNVKSGGGPGMARSEAQRQGVQAVMARFDLVVESSIEGIRKPDPAIYELTCQRLGARPGACVFLDDLGVNLKPARALGMHTIKVLSENQALAELAAATGLALEG